jgi:hypothetical protein
MEPRINIARPFGYLAPIVAATLACSNAGAQSQQAQQLHFI